MGKTARNSIKGYTYQQSIFVLFLAIMDTQRNIAKIEVETLDTKNFDDLYIEYLPDMESKGSAYRIQVKNYPGTSLADIAIYGNTLSIKGNSNEFDPNDCNILVVNTTLIETDDIFMGLNCTKLNDIIIIPLTTDQLAEKMDAMFESEARELQIIHKADDITENAKFTITIDELPELIQMSTDLENKTIILRNAPDDFPHNITFIEGKPGVGKSHFVNEICEKNPAAVVYRFWTGSQDPNKNDRLHFDKFISELGIKVYHSSKKVYINELVKYIQEKNILLIIDGLDHIENYNPQQLELFIGFIDLLKETRTIVLSRPLKHQITWDKITLLDWTFDETRVYLEMAHNISDYPEQSQIFHLSSGYPIITYFLAEDYKLNGHLNLTSPITGINEYYDNLFQNQDKPSSAIGVFASGSCFFTWAELKSFFSDPEVYDVIEEFISLHPYLFKIIVNRVSLIHDSLNTYLRTKIQSFSFRRDQTINIIRKSLLNGSIEYMARMESFSFDNVFYAEMLKKYSKPDEFEKLILSTRDYNSISSLYKQLQKILESRPEILNIYELYSFALLFQIAIRNDLIGYDSLVYQMLLYLHSHSDIENSIFSSDYIWQVYLTCKGKKELAEQYLNNKNMESSQIYDLIEHINDDYTFFEKKDKQMTYADLLQSLTEGKTTSFEKKEVLADYLVSIWIHGTHENEYFDEFYNYVTGNENSCPTLQEDMLQYGLDKTWVKLSVNSAKYTLHELGFFEENNKFRKYSLYDLILLNAPNGSFNVADLVASYLKLANHENRSIDIENLAYWWTMYSERKDYSVATIDEALLAFENKGLINWKQSIEIISKLMKQSEKGISHLLTQYINKKGTDCIRFLNEMGYFKSEDCLIDFWELNPETYLCFDDADVVFQVMKLLSIHYHSKTIEGRDIHNICHSVHRDLVLCGIKKYGYNIISPDEDLIPTLAINDIGYSGLAKKEKDTYVPLRYDCLHEEDFPYIAEHKIDCLKVAQYADGWYSCLPFVDVFSLYPIEDVQKNCTSIIHTSMFARVVDNDFIGNWFKLIGNIPAFLLKYKIDIDWNRLYSVFNDFMELSLIYHIKS